MIAPEHAEDSVVALTGWAVVEGGRIVACGTPAEIKQIDESITGHYI